MSGHNFFHSPGELEDFRRCKNAIKRYIDAHRPNPFPPFEDVRNRASTTSTSHAVRSGLEHFGDRLYYNIVDYTLQRRCPDSIRHYKVIMAALTCNDVLGYWMSALGMHTLQKDKTGEDTSETILGALLDDLPLDFVIERGIECLGPLIFVCLATLSPGKRKRDEKPDNSLPLASSSSLPPLKRQHVHSAEFNISVPQAVLDPLVRQDTTEPSAAPSLRPLLDFLDRAKQAAGTIMIAKMLQEKPEDGLASLSSHGWVSLHTSASLALSFVNPPLQAPPRRTCQEITNREASFVSCEAVPSSELPSLDLLVPNRHVPLVHDKSHRDGRQSRSLSQTSNALNVQKNLYRATNKGLDDTADKCEELSYDPSRFA
ncbi:hypothetical protein FB451DRAFT_1471286 [Mycena latifolia]|nr:hypothetical protein FB451DRAFT_1471286 [Mycena latifolia]